MAKMMKMRSKKYIITGVLGVIFSTILLLRYNSQKEYVAGEWWEVVGQIIGASFLAAIIVTYLGLQGGF